MMQKSRQTRRVTKPVIGKVLRTSRTSKRAILITFAVLFAGVGVYLTLFSGASGVAPSIEPETATLTAPATAIDDASASNGKAVRFATASSGSSGTGIPTEFCPNPSNNECRPYNPDGPWNTPIGNSPQVHTNSAAYIQRMIDKTPVEGGGITDANGFNKVLTSDTGQYSIPIYKFNASTPRASVIMSGYFGYYDTNDGSRVSPGFAATIPNVPIPPDAIAGAGSDGQITFWDATTGEEWGFWQFYKDGSGNYHATNGFRYHTTATFNGRFSDGLSGRGAGTTYFSGLVRPWEIAQGRIDHALSLAFAGPSPEFVYPASKSDGGNFGGVSGVDIPEGGRVQLDPTLTDADFTAWGLNAQAKIVAKALQQYGAYVIDNSGSTKLYVEYQETAQWNTSQVNRNFLSKIPLNKFRVLAFPSSGTGGGSSTPDQANPTPPTSVTATPGNGQITVRWSGATDDVGVTGYVVRYRAAGSSAAFTDIEVGNSLVHTITGLTNGQGYNIMVRAKDAAGKTSTDSSLAQATPSASATNPPLSKDNGNCPALASTLYGTATASVTVPSSGTYKVWSRIKVPDTTNNSYYFQVGNNCEMTIGNSSGITPGSWVWVSYKDGNTSTPAEVSLSSGTHTVVLTGAESGVEVDKVMFLDDSCVPNGTGSNCPENGGNTYYVATTGNDSNAGSAAAPFKTLQKAADMANACDTVIVKDGTYTVTSGSTFVTTSKAGNSTCPITFKSENKWGAKLDGQKSSRAAFVLAAGAQYIRIENFEMYDFAAGQITAQPSLSGDAAAIDAYAGGANSIFKGNYIHDIGKNCTNTTNGEVAIFMQAPNITVEGNYIHEIGRYQAGESGCGTNYTTDRNHDHGIYVNGSTGGGGAGGASGAIIKNNIFNNTYAGFAIQLYPGTLSNVKVVNNTFNNCNSAKSYACIITGANFSNVAIQNNIVKNPSGVFIEHYQGPYASFTVANNLLSGSAIWSTATPSGVTMTANQLNTDPKLVDPANGDFSLQSSSPAIDAGATITEVSADFNNTSRPQGSVYEIGAFEYAAIGGGGATADTTAPTVPSGLSMATRTSSSISVGWNASTDSGGSGLAGYRLYRGGSLIGTVNAATQSFTNTGLTADTAYSYQIAAYDNAGNESAKSSTLSVTTLANTTPAPTPTPTPKPKKKGDVNGDNKVDLKDLSMLLSRYRTNNKDADMNEDNWVDLKDLSIVLSNYGK
jgi:chitodextrinase